MPDLLYADVLTRPSSGQATTELQLHDLSVSASYSGATLSRQRDRIRVDGQSLLARAGFRIA